jgi:hypothetical protein
MSVDKTDGQLGAADIEGEAELAVTRWFGQGSGSVVVAEARPHPAAHLGPVVPRPVAAGTP